MAIQRSNSTIEDHGEWENSIPLVWMELNFQQIHCELEVLDEDKCFGFFHLMVCFSRPPKELFRILFSLVSIFNLLLVSLQDQVLLKLLWRQPSLSVLNVSYPQGKKKGKEKQKNKKTAITKKPTQSSESQGFYATTPFGKPTYFYYFK